MYPCVHACGHFTVNSRWPEYPAFGFRSSFLLLFCFFETHFWFFGSLYVAQAGLNLPKLVLNCQSFCLSLPSTEIPGMYHCAYLAFEFLYWSFLDTWCPLLAEPQISMQSGNPYLGHMGSWSSSFPWRSILYRKIVIIIKSKISCAFKPLQTQTRLMADLPTWLDESSMSDFGHEPRHLLIGEVKW